MPSPSQLMKEYGLNKGSKLYTSLGKLVGTIKAISSDHIALKPREKYMIKFDMTILSKTVSLARVIPDIKAAIRHHTASKDTIYSAYGSPYQCVLMETKIKNLAKDNEYKATLTIIASRRRDIPTLAQKRRLEQQTGDATGKNRLVSDEEMEQYLDRGTMRIIKSRFGSSKCVRCNETIDPGILIVRPNNVSYKGGWSHAVCEIEHRKKSLQKSKRKKEKY